MKTNRDIAKEIAELQRLINDEEIEDIWVNGPGIPVFVWHRRRGMMKLNLKFSREALEVIVKRIAETVGKPLDEDNPILDASLTTGDRVAITLPPVAPKGPSICIRKFRRKPFSLTELIANDTIPLDLAGLLWLAVEGMGVRPMNILIAGGTASGKTTLLNALLTAVRSNERIITVEDTRELNISFIPNWEPLEARPLFSGKEVTMDDLLKHALRKRPTRVIVGEVRGPEAYTLLEAMNIGHLGSMGTIHANNAREAINRLRHPPMSVPLPMISYLDMIISLGSFYVKSKPARRVTEVVLIEGFREGKIIMDTCYVYSPEKGRAVPSSYPYLLFEKIGEALEISHKEVEEEAKKRMSILADMVKKRIFDVDRTREVFERYYARGYRI